MISDRWVVVDNADPSISYSESWISSRDNSQGNVGRIVPPYQETLYTTFQSGTASFQFSGTAVEVWGTTVADPTAVDLQCFVNETSIDHEEFSPIAANNQRLCGTIGLPNGTHRLRVEVTVGPTAPLFWLDQIRYIPSSNLPLDNQIILVENTDPAVWLDTQTQWITFGGIANITYGSGSRPLAVVTFTGVSISWFGLIPPTLPQSVGTSGSWSIDGGPETSFNLYGLPTTANSTLYNQQYFTTPDYPMGFHNLTVNFDGGQDTVPFSLDYLYVKNGTFAVNNSTGTSDLGGPNRGILAAGIVGGVLGIVAILGLVAALFLLRRRRRMRKRSLAITTPTQFRPYDTNGPLSASSNSSLASLSSASTYTTIPRSAYQAAGITDRAYNPWHFWSLENGKYFPLSGAPSRVIIVGF